MKLTKSTPKCIRSHILWAIYQRTSISILGIYIVCIFFEIWRVPVILQNWSFKSISKKNSLRLEEFTSNRITGQPLSCDVSRDHRSPVVAKAITRHRVWSCSIYYYFKLLSLISGLEFIQFIIFARFHYKSKSPIKFARTYELLRSDIMTNVFKFFVRIGLTKSEYLRMN